ncbi:MAG: biotin--[acetyl-CoA-carboxylase] ligase, partial [Ruthenibacterium sp.]
VRPAALAAADGGLATTAAAVAVCGALADLCGVDAGIKWVNDVFFRERKVCGILTEAGTNVETGDLDWMVVGIGLNLTAPVGGWPAEIADIAGEIFPDGILKVSSNELAAEIISRFAALLPNLAQKSFMAEYRRRSILRGREILVLPTGREPYPARVLDIDDEGKLLVELPNGNRTALLTGEVSIRLSDKTTF